MARRRPSPPRGPRSNAPPKSRGQRPGSKPRSGPIGGPRRDPAEPRPEARAKPQLAKKGQGGLGEKPERLQKVLAHAGLGSRRGCEELILQGRVSINGEIVRQLGTRVDRSTARIAVDGEPIQLESKVYYAVNKPKGYVSTNFDPSGRPRVVDLLPEIPERVYTVGRLDEESTGLMILTNDGDLANRLAHPRYGVEKLYRALVAGLPTPEMLAKLTEGVWLSDGKVRAKRARIAGRQGQATSLELVLAEGKKREIRRMLSKLGHKVMALNRIAVGPISLKGLAVGECRPLSRHEIELLQKVAAGAHRCRRLAFLTAAQRAARTAMIAAPENPITPGLPATTTTLRGPAGPKTAMDHPRGDHRGTMMTILTTVAVPGNRGRGARQPQAGLVRRRLRPPRQADHAGRKVPSKVAPKRIDQSNVPARLRRKGPAPVLPPEPLKVKRRIIGLEPEAPVRTGPGTSGSRGRKRPPARKRLPPGPTLRKNGKTPRPSSNDDGDEQ